MQDKYYGSNKIVGVSETDWKTPLGGKVVCIVLDNGYSTYVPEEFVKQLVTDEKSTASDMSERRIELLATNIIKTLVDSDISAIEIEFLFKSLSNKITNIFDRVGHVSVNTVIHGKPNDELWVPGANYMHRQTLIECEKILKDVGRKETTENGKATS